MSSKEFWEDDPKLYWAYRDFYILKQQTESNNMWLMGRYVFDAMSVVMNNSFGKEAIPYLEKPYKLFDTEEQKEEKDIKEQENENKWARIL